MNTISRCRCFAVAFASIGLATLPARSQITPGQPLAVAHIFHSSGSLYVVNSLVIRIGYFSPIDGLFTAAPLFEQFSLTSSDVGRILTLTSANDPDFDSFVQKLTNGTDDGIGVSDNLDVTTGANESEFFDLLPAGHNGIDLQGFQIGSISMELDRISVDSPGSDPNGDGSWTDIVFDGTVTVYAVPEPSTWMLLAVASLACWWFRRRRLLRPVQTTLRPA